MTRRLVSKLSQVQQNVSLMEGRSGVKVFAVLKLSSSMSFCNGDAGRVIHEVFHSPNDSWLSQTEGALIPCSFQEAVCVLDTLWLVKSICRMLVYWPTQWLSPSACLSRSVAVDEESVEVLSCLKHQIVDIDRCPVKRNTIFQSRKRVSQTYLFMNLSKGFYASVAMTSSYLQSPSAPYLQRNENCSRKEGERKAKYERRA